MSDEWRYKMSSVDKFWLTMWSIIAFFVTIIVTGLLLYYSHKNELIVKAIADSNNPIAVKCALDVDGMSDKSICSLIAVGSE